jgi:ATP-dependent Clp endopeptidase proteolytic subunit ClpP
MPENSTSFGTQLFDELLKERIVFLGSEVTDESANVICGQLLLLAAADPDRDIQLYINSPGGSVSAGLAVYDTMRFIANDVATIAMGMAGSMGQFLLTAGTPGKRFALPHARIMMHQPPAASAERPRHHDPGREHAVREAQDARADRVAQWTGRSSGSRRTRTGTGGSPREPGQGLRPDRPGDHGGRCGPRLSSSGSFFAWRVNMRPWISGLRTRIGSGWSPPWNGTPAPGG